MKVLKTQSVDEFLARGGKITRVDVNNSTLKDDYAKSNKKVDSVKSTKTASPASILSMEEADLYHGEHKPKKVKKKIGPVMDVSALPEALRKKYIDEVIDGQEDQEDDGED